MQTMTALVRISGNPAMTVQLRMVTPAEAWLLMHIHDPDTKDVFEQAVLSGDVQRTRIDERERLIDKYPQYKPLIDGLYPGRTASDIPLSFGDLDGVPLSVTAAARAEKGAALTRAAVHDAPADAGEAFIGSKPVKGELLTEEQQREAFLGGAT